MLFANRIRKLRESEQMLQRNIAAALDMDNAMYCKIERGNRRAKREHIPIIAEILQAEPEKLLTLWFADQVTEIAGKDKGILDKVLETAKQSLNE